MRKPSTPPIEVEQVPFNGLALTGIAEIDIESVLGSVFVFMRRRDGGIVRVWISRPDAERSTVPLRVTMEAEE